MKFDHNSIDQDEWSRIVSRGLKSGIRDRSDYIHECKNGLDRALRMLGPCDSALRPVEIRAVHAAIFRDIHPWAGETLPLRSESLSIGNTGLKGDLPEVLREKLVILSEGSKKDFSWAGSSVDRQAEAIASSYLALKRIQAFRDGNGRTAGIIAEHQIRKCFGIDVTQEISRPRIITEEALVKALLKNDHRLIADSIVVSLGLGHQVEASRSQALQHEATEQLRTGVATGRSEPHQFVHQALEEARQQEHSLLRRNNPVPGLKEGHERRYVPESLAASKRTHEEVSANLTLLKKLQGKVANRAGPGREAHEAAQRRLRPPADPIAEARGASREASARRKEDETNTLGNKIETFEKQDRESVARFEELQEQQRKRAEESVTRTQKHSR